MNLYVVRHGETDMGKNHIIANETEPLNANGIRQAQNLHNELEKLRIDRIYVSPIQRAKDTLFYFHLSKDIPVEIEPRIKERDMGKYAGVPFYDLDWDNFWGFHSNQKYPNCESMADTFFRVSDFIKCLSLFDFIYYLFWNLAHFYLLNSYLVFICFFLCYIKCFPRILLSIANGYLSLFNSYL